MPDFEMRIDCKLKKDAVRLERKYKKEPYKQYFNCRDQKTLLMKFKTEIERERFYIQMSMLSKHLQFTVQKLK